MKKLLGITLGIMTALGGFVDLGQIVFTLQAGALFQYRLLWTIVLGTVAIIVYMEMCGRVAVVTKKPVFAVVRDSLGMRLGVMALIASNLLNVITCAAELGGIAIVLHLLTGWAEKPLLLATAAAFLFIVGGLRFQWIERIFGLAGLAMIVAAVSAVMLHPDWRAVARGALPVASVGDSRETLRYWYFAVGIFSAMLMEYEVHFYSSGVIEERWKLEDLSENFAVACLGSVCGALLTVALLILGALLFLPRGIFPEHLSTATVAIAAPLGRRGMLFGLLGAMACMSGAAVETMLSGAYNLCQFFDWPWGKNSPIKSVPTFTKSWIGMLAIALLLVLSGLRPSQLVNLSVIFGMVVMPFTYYPVLRVAMDEGIMGKHVNQTMDTALGAAILVLIVGAAVAAIPLMLATDFGRP